MYYSGASPAKISYQKLCLVVTVKIPKNPVYLFAIALLNCGFNYTLQELIYKACLVNF